MLVTGAGPIGLLAVQRGTPLPDHLPDRSLPVGAESVIDPGMLNRNMVLQNSVLFGSVNASRGHYELAAKALAQADPRWLADLITRQVPLNQWADAYARRPDDIKTVLDFPEASP